MHEQRLRNVVRALRESPAPDEFTMGCFVHDCGTPGCALGHYAARTDLQNDYALHRADEAAWMSYQGRGLRSDHRDSVEHFAISEGESRELFSFAGCAIAKTVEEAATYIEGFIDRKLAVEEVTAPKETAVPA